MGAPEGLTSQRCASSLLLQPGEERLLQTAPEIVEPEMFRSELAPRVAEVLVEALDPRRAIAHLALSTPLISRVRDTRRRSTSLNFSGAKSSAAAVGVGARLSATKSLMVKSTSWPTAETTGIGQVAMARATTSSLNAQRSSSEPPPRVTTSTSRPGAFSAPGMPAHQGAGRTRHLLPRAVALHPTGSDQDGQIAGNRWWSTRRKSRMAAPLGLVTTPMRRGRYGMGRFRALGEEALGGETALQLLEGQRERADPRGLEGVADQLVLAARLEDVEVAASDDLLAVLQIET